MKIMSTQTLKFRFDCRNIYISKAINIQIYSQITIFIFYSQTVFLWLYTNLSIVFICCFLSCCYCMFLHQDFWSTFMLTTWWLSKKFTTASWEWNLLAFVILEQFSDHCADKQKRKKKPIFSSINFLRFWKKK